MFMSVDAVLNCVFGYLVILVSEKNCFVMEMHLKNYYLLWVNKIDRT